MDPFDVDCSSVSTFSLYAVEAAKEYVDLMESQISQSHAAMRSAAIKKSAGVDEEEYDIHVRPVEEAFDEHRQILRYTEVVYLCILLETYLKRHFTQIQELRNRKPDNLEKWKEQKNFNCGLVEAAQKYFQDDAKWSIFTLDEWEALREISAVRNCIVHAAGIARDHGLKGREDIKALEERTWRKKPVGVEIEKVDGRDFGRPIIIHKQFPQYIIHLLDKLFKALEVKTHAEFLGKAKL